ncbi:LacI family transcriptional regulator, partial [Rhizobium johnstonii]
GSVLDEVQQFRPRAVAYAAMYHKDVALPDRLAGAVGVMINCREAAGRVTALVPDEEGGAREIVRYLLVAG